MNKTPLYLFILMLAVHSCSKEKGKHIYINDGLKAGYNFRPGSYWIFRDSATGRTDSFYVSHYEAYTNSTTPHNPNEAVHTDAIQIIVSRKIIVADSAHSDTGQWTLFLEDNMLNCRYTSYPAVAANGIVSLNIYYPFTDGPTYSANDTVMAHTIGSFTISNKTYQQVTEFDHYTNLTRSWLQPPYLIYDDQLFLSPGVGIIKLRLNHPVDSVYRVWELQRYNVVR